jgi:hypothetical protein
MITNISNISNKLNLLTINTKLLIIGNVSEDLNIIINKYFKNIENLDFTNNTFNILNENYFEQFDIVLFIFNKDSFSLYKENYNSLPKNSIFIISKEVYFDYWSYLNYGYATLLDPIVEDTLVLRLFGLLSIEETNILLQSKVKVFNKYKDDDVNDDIDLFLEKYIGEIMFINDELNENLNRLKELEISKEIFSSISLNLIKLSNVMKNNDKLIHLSNIFSEFSKFIDNLDLESINPSKYIAFDYLTNIIDDLTIYIDELFVYRIFKDVRIFEDSMENNIGYFEAKLNGTSNEEDDNLEFF